MDTEKLITVVVWATIVLVVYELFKSFSSGVITSQVASGLADILGTESSSLVPLTDELPTPQDELEASSPFNSSTEWAF